MRPAPLPAADEVSEDTLNAPPPALDPSKLWDLVARVASGETETAEVRTSGGRALLIFCPDDDFAEELDAAVAVILAAREGDDAIHRREVYR